jgi:predicted dehydrogenase
MADSREQPREQAAKPLRVGVIGLGRRWQRRYRSALAALRERFQVSAVCDHVQERAVQEGRRLSCAAVAGPTELLERRDTDAVLLVDRQWYRLWPVEAACRWGKPVFCCDGLEWDDAHADALYGRVQASGLPVMMALSPRVAPAAVQLREILDRCAAQAQLVVCSIVTSWSGGRASKGAGAANSGRGSLPLLDLCASLLPGTPRRILAAGLTSGELGTLLLAYADGRALQLNRYRLPGAARACRLDVLTDRGTAVAHWPRRVRWADAEGQVWPRPAKDRPAAETLLDHFHAAITSARVPFPDLAHAYRLLGWWRVARRSFQESRWVEVPGGGRA